MKKNTNTKYLQNKKLIAILSVSLIVVISLYWYYKDYYFVELREAGFPTGKYKLVGTVNEGEEFAPLSNRFAPIEIKNRACRRGLKPIGGHFSPPDTGYEGDTHYCTNCGNGVCDPIELRYNCPEDCGVNGK